jgi:hypothetical protein
VVLVALSAAATTGSFTLGGVTLTAVAALSAAGLRQRFERKQQARAERRETYSHYLTELSAVVNAMWVRVRKEDGDSLGALDAETQAQWSDLWLQYGTAHFQVRLIGSDEVAQTLEPIAVLLEELYLSRQESSCSEYEAKLHEVFDHKQLVIEQMREELHLGTLPAPLRPRA